MELRVTLKPSRLHRAFVLISSGAALMGILAAHQSLSACLLLLILWSCFLFFAWRAYLEAPTQVKIGSSTLELEIDDLWLEQGNPRVLPFVVVFPGHRLALAPMIWSDAIQAEQWRQLRMALKVHSIQPTADDHVLAGKVDRHHDGVFGNRR